MASIQNGYLRIQPSNRFNYYQTSARELHHFLYPLHRTQADFRQWIDDTLAFYGFEEHYDFAVPNQTAGYTLDDGDEDDIILRLDTAKELARVARTERGREARYYFIEFENQLREQHNPNELDKKIRQLNALAQSMKVGESVVYLSILDLTNLLQAIRQYQRIAHCYIPSEHKIDLIWINELITKIKRATGKLVFYSDEQEYPR